MKQLSIMKGMLENFGLYKAMKSDRIKDLLIRHFRDAIDFHTRHERNKSAIMYTAGEQAKLTTKQY